MARRYTNPEHGAESISPKRNGAAEGIRKRAGTKVAEMRQELQETLQTTSDADSLEGYEFGEESGTKMPTLLLRKYGEKDSEALVTRTLEVLVKKDKKHEAVDTGEQWRVFLLTSEKLSKKPMTCTKGSTEGQSWLRVISGRFKILRERQKAKLRRKIDPTAPTTAAPGSPDKVDALIARRQAGMLSLFHDEDCDDQSRVSPQNLSRGEEADTPLEGWNDEDE